MLACVCQPTDPGIFRRSPIPLGAPPLKFNHKGAIPKPGRTLRIPVITDEPKHQLANRNNHSSSSNSDSNSSKSNKSEKRKILNGSDKKRSHRHQQIREAQKCTVSVNKCASASPSTSTTLASSEGCNRKEEERRQHQVGAKGTEEAEREEITLDSKELPGTSLKSADKRPIRKLNDFEKLPEGVQLTLSELREMACRQQAQIDSQHQLLAAKEQRLRYLKEQEARQQRVQAESERLRRLRDRVDAQELKLRKLRAIRGQVDHQKQNNLSLTSDLDSIRALFNEKEKELSLAVAKVEELTRQLEELRRGRSARDQPPASALELDKLRRELMYRNKLNEQQNQRLNQQREALTARQEEMSAIDKRISELQERLHRKRLLNQQLANQISATSHKAAYHQLVRLTGTNDQNSQGYPRKPQHPVNHSSSGLSRTNIAAVEPYNHVPLQSGQQQTRNAPHNTNSENTTYHPIYQQQGSHIKNEIDHHQDNQELSNNTKVASTYGTKQEETDILKDFAVSKSDPKYQTLPYNTKFTVNIIPNKASGKTNDPNDNNLNSGDLKDFEPNNHISSHINANMQSHCHTVHSAPLSVVNKNIATPLNQNDLINRKSLDSTKEQQHTDSRNSQNGIKNVDNSGPITTVNNSAIPPYQKPISSVAPTSVHNNGKISNIYQTASIKVQPVEPQTVLSAHKQLTPTQPNVSLPQSLALSPPQSTSTPLSTPEISVDKTKPALPPKPAIKPPPRQTQIIPDDTSQPPPLPTTEPPSDDKVLAKPQAHLNKPLPQAGATNQSSISNQKNYPMQLTSQSSQSTANNQSSSMSYTNDNMPIIKAKPLTIKKQPMSEQPKLRSLSSYSKQNGLSSRRIEMPPTFHFTETTSDKSSENESSSETSKEKNSDETDKTSIEDSELKDKEYKDTKTIIEGVVRRCKKGNLKQNGKANLSRRVSFDPLALLLDASLEGELELVKKTASQVPNPSAANDEGITALHNAICAGHLEIVKFLVEFGCDVNAQDSDGWTPLHCAASCNNVAMVKFLVEHGACIFATTLSDHETAAEKCEEDEEGFDGCSEYLYSVQEKLGILSGGVVYAVFDYSAQQPDELSFIAGQQLTVLRKGDENEREWWWSRLGDKEGYIPRNLLGLYPRVTKCED